MYPFAALFTVARIWKQPKYPATDEWIKMWLYTHTHTHTHTHTMEYYLAISKHKILTFVTTQIDLDGISEKCQRKTNDFTHK